MTVRKREQRSRQDWELEGLANADLKYPIGSPRESRRLRAALLSDEKLERLFLTYHGARMGLAIFTNQRFIFAFRSLLRPRPIVLPYRQITCVRVTKPGKRKFPTFRVSHGRKEERFWLGTDDEARKFLEAMREHIGDRLLDERSAESKDPFAS